MKLRGAMAKRLQARELKRAKKRAPAVKKKTPANKATKPTEG
jgi:hypothetical protein